MLRCLFRQDNLGGQKPCKQGNHRRSCLLGEVRLQSSTTRMLFDVPRALQPSSPSLGPDKYHDACSLWVCPPPPFPLLTTCIQFLLVPSYFSCHFLLSSRQPTSHSVWWISRTTPMQSAALTPEVTQRVLQQRLDLPTRPARPDADQMPRTSGGLSSLSHFPHGFFPGSLLPASSLLALEII